MGDGSSERGEASRPSFELPRALTQGARWIALAFLLATVAAASSIEILNGDGLDHLNSARWLWRGQQWARFIDHRPPTLTYAMVPFAFLYEVVGLRADTILTCARLLSALALLGASVGVALALPPQARALRWIAALLTASSPLLLALAPTFSQDACAAGGVGLVFWLQRRLHRGPGGRGWLVLGVVAGATALLRYDTGVVVIGLAAGELWGRAPLRRTLATLAVTAACASLLFVSLYWLRFGADIVGGLEQTFLDAGEAVSVTPRGQAGPWALYPRTWLRTAGPVLLLLALWGGGRALRTRDPVGTSAVVCLTVWGVEFFGVVANAHPRYMGQLVPAVSLLACLGLADACRRFPSRRVALVVAALAWPLALGPQEVWTFTDPAYQKPTERNLVEAVRALGPRKVWQVGGHYVLRPARSGFVEGDVSTRVLAIGIGGLNFRLRQPVYNTVLQGALWETFLPMEDGDAGLIVAPTDLRLWPVMPSAGARLFRLRRETLERDGSVFRAAGVVAQRALGALRLRSERDLGERAVVLLDGRGVGRSLGVRRLRAGDELVFELGPDVPCERVVLLGGEVGPLRPY